jgi:hypothetical protein
LQAQHLSRIPHGSDAGMTGRFLVMGAVRHTPHNATHDVEGCGNAAHTAGK